MNVRTYCYSGLCLAFLVIAISCSQAISQTTPGVEISKSPHSSDAHHLLGLYTFTCDPCAGSIEVTPMRRAEMHLNALPFLEPPVNIKLTLESPPVFSGNILDIDIGLRHPFLGLLEYTGFDVCGIVFAHGSITGFSDPELILAGKGDTRLLNADGHTRWWNPAEFPHGDQIFNYVDGLLGTPASIADFNCTLNGYKYFASGLEKNDPVTNLDLAKRGMLAAGQKCVRHYKMDLSGGLIFNYAVDACWKHPNGLPPYSVPDDFPPEANRPEAYNIVVTEVENSLYFEIPSGYPGGKLKLRIDVWDHFDAHLNEVYAESLAGLPLTAALTPVGGGDGYSTYELDFTGDALNQGGQVDLLVAVKSEASGYGGILPGKPVCAYYVHPLNIRDPKGWARAWGGPGEYMFGDSGHDIAVDNSGNIYIVGAFSSTVDFDPGPGIEEHSSIGEGDVFLSKFTPNGVFQWVRTWLGDMNHEDQRSYSIAIGPFGEIYVAGTFTCTVDFDPGPMTYYLTPSGYSAAFLSKFDTDGNFLWALSWGGLAIEARGIATDIYGNVFVTGWFQTLTDFDPGSGVDEHPSNGGNDVFLSVIRSNGEFVAARTWGGWFVDVGCAVATDTSGNIYVTGYFEDTVDFDPGPGHVHYTAKGGQDVFLSKFNAAGDFQWAATWGGGIGIGGLIGNDAGYSLATDSFDNIYVTGMFTQPLGGAPVDFDPGPGQALRSSYNSDVFLSKFEPDGAFQWVRTWGGYIDQGNGVAIDGWDNVYVTGYFDGTCDFHPGPGVEEITSNGGPDVFLSKFDNDGVFQWARTWGGGEYNSWDLPDRGNGVVTADSLGNAYVTGFFCGTVDFDPGPYSYVLSSVSNADGYPTTDVFLCKYPPDGNW